MYYYLEFNRNIALGTGKNYDLTSGAEGHEEFNKWLQCYNKSDMDSMADHNKRMVWFKVSSCNVMYPVIH